MDQQLPQDIRKIPSPLIAFCGDNSLSVFIADRFFQDGSSRYSIEFLSDQQDLNSMDMKNDEKFEGRTIMKGSWYKKHSHRQPALCLFCISVDLVQLSQERGKWLQMVSEQFSSISNQFTGKKPSFISIFVCPGNKESLPPNGFREDVLIRDLNTLTIDHLHSYLFFEEELIGSSLSSIKSLKAEVFQICHNYYSDRLDILDSDMNALNPDNPPEQIIRVMLKMSFFNECLSSLNLQESNAIYSYNRCLDHYLRVQDYCISLFSKMKKRRNEEIRQILSLVNFKVVLYSLLIQQAKGIIQLTKKITRCIHAVSAILYDDSSALFSLWKATQYQFIIDEFSQLNTDVNLTSDIRESLQSCYFYRMYYAREAYILSFEHSLCSFLSPNGKPHSRDFSDSLFLSTNWYANEEEYLMALRDQIQFDVIFEDSFKACIQNNTPSLIHSSILDVITRILTEMKLPSDEEETRIIRTLLQLRLFNLLKLLLLLICYLSYYHRLQSKLIHSLLLLNIPAISLAPESRVLFYHYCCDHFADLTPFHLDTVLLIPIEWCLLTERLCVKDDELVPVKLVLKNPFPCLITMKKIQWLENTQSIELVIQPNCVGFVNLTFPAKSLNTQPLISLQIEELPSSFGLSSFFCTLCETPFDLTHINVNQVQILPQITPLMSVSSEETVIIGKMNCIELPLLVLSESVTVKVSCDKKEMEEVCEYKREGSLSRLFIDLRDPKWFGKQSFCSCSFIVNKGQQEQTYSLKLNLKPPFDVISDLTSYQGHFYSMYKNQLSIKIHSLLESVTIQKIKYFGNDGIQWKSLSDSNMPTVLNINEDYNYEFAIQTTTQDEKMIDDHSFQIHYSIMNEPCLCQVAIPALHMEKPPIVYTVNLNSTLIKGVPCDGSISITNTAETDQMVVVALKKDGTKWIMNGVLEHNYSIPPGHSIIHSFSIIPIRAGSQDYSLCSIQLPNLKLQIEGFFPPNHVFVKDSDCIL